ncbi:Aminopeptidase M1-B [Dictyocoela muelleri]|nr:Aminopeptidase M1-B [Dictyocoela muelleri]
MNIAEPILNFKEKVKKFLHRNIKPIHYDIFISHNDDDFYGNVNIVIEVTEETEFIIINTRDLHITSCEVDGIVCSFSAEENEEVKILVGKMIFGNKNLRIEFSGHVSYNMKGFYISQYHVNGVKKKLYSTKFEPTHARMLIPCFDQPDMKATFKLTLETENVEVISNTHGKSKLLSNGRKVTTFEETPKMSTYLLAFVIGEIEYIEDYLNNIQIRVYTIEGEKEKGKYALTVAIQCLDFFQQYFSFPYPLKKLDLVGIPEFASGAMENWGIVTFRETALLYDPYNSNVHQKKRIAEVVCHELAHQWFGNLVTMKWWDDLWLNEGFATYAATLAMDNIQIVNWDVWTDFIASETARGLEEDALNSSHPIKVDVYDPNDIDQIFDVISYSKSASLIRMIEKFLGNDKFQSSLANYIKKFQYSNATTDDLWEMLSDDNHDISKIMNNWVNKKGFPLVHATEVDGQLLLTQEKFQALQEEKLGTSIESKSDSWMIPMTIIYGKTKAEIFMKEKTESIFLSGNYKLNYDGAAFVRVLYSPFKDLLQNEHDVRDRLTFVNDVVSLTLASYLPINSFLGLLNHFIDEKNYEVMNSVIGGLSAYRDLFPEKRNFFNEKIVKLLNQRRIKDYSEEIDGSETDEINQSSLNSLIVSSLVGCKDKETLYELNKLYKKYRNNHHEVVHPIYRSAMFRAVMITEDLYDEILEIYKHGNISLRVAALMSLGMTEKHLERHLNQLIGDEIKLQDKVYIVFGLMNRIESRKKVMNYFIRNFEKIRVLFRNNGRLLSYCVEHIFSYAFLDQDLERTINFFEGIDKQGIERAIDKAIEKSKIKNSFRKRNIDLIEDS